MKLYDRASPSGELDGAMLIEILNQAGLTGAKRAIFTRHIIKVNRIIKEHYASQRQQS